MAAEWGMPSLPFRLTEPVGVPEPEERETVPLTVVVLPWTSLTGLTLRVVVVAEKQPVRWADQPVSPRHVEVDALPKRDGIRIAGGESELGDDRSGDGHRRGQIAVYMLECPEEEQLVSNDPAATIGHVRIDIHVRGRGGGGQQFGARAEWRPAENVGCLSVVIVAARLRDGVEHRAHRVAELGSESVADLLHLLNVGVRDRDEADPGAVALGVVAAVQLVIDPAIEAVSVHLAWHAELGICPAADVWLKEDEIVGVARHQRQTVGRGVVERAAKCCSAGVGDRCCGGHFNLGAHAGDLEREVDRDCRAGVDRYPSAACIRKPYSLGREVVGAYRQQTKPVEAGLCGSGGLLEARRHVDDLNDGARDAGA